MPQTDAAARASSRSALHSSESSEHGSPAPAVELVRHALGGIDLDPASSAYFNHHVVRAARFYDERADGLRMPWRGRVWLNPPGDRRGRLVRAFWERLVEHYRAGLVTAAGFLAFSLEQLVHLQNAPMAPTQFVMLIPRERLEFLVRDPRGGAPFPQPNPTHGNAIVLLPDRGSPTLGAEQLQRFVRRARRLDSGVAGAIVRPL